MQGEPLDEGALRVHRHDCLTPEEFNVHEQTIEENLDKSPCHSLILAQLGVTASCMLHNFRLPGRLGPAPAATRPMQVIQVGDHVGWRIAEADQRTSKDTPSTPGTASTMHNNAFACQQKRDNPFCCRANALLLLVRMTRRHSAVEIHEPRTVPDLQGRWVVWNHVVCETHHPLDSDRGQTCPPL